MMRSISPRWASEKLWAPAGTAAAKARKAAAAATRRRDIIGFLLTFLGRYGRFAAACQLTAVSTRPAMIAAGYRISLASFGRYVAISSALTQPGEPVGSRVLARAASSRAVLKSPEANDAWAEARSAWARSPFWP